MLFLHQLRWSCYFCPSFWQFGIWRWLMFIWWNILNIPGINPTWWWCITWKCQILLPSNLLIFAVAPHSSTLAWKIPWTEEPRRLQSMGREESDTTEQLRFHVLEKEMATHSSVLAWRIPGTGEPGVLPSMGSHRVGHDWSDLAAAASIFHQGYWCVFFLSHMSLILASGLCWPHR